MVEVKVLEKMPEEIMKIVKELRSLGYQQGNHFDFTYRPPKYDDFSMDAVYNRHTVFTFYKEELASWFALRFL